MSYLLSKKKNNKNGCIQNINAENTELKYVGFDAYLMNKGESITFNSDTDEVCIVLIAGYASVITDDESFINIGKRMSPFERIPPYSVYVPNNKTIKIVAETDLEVAICKAPGFNNFPTRLIEPHHVQTENRGKGRNKRYVQNILPDTEPADSLLVVEVFTDEGNTSSYPSHKHDQDNFPHETFLEETYYHRFDPQQGFCLQRVYTDDRTLDECAAVYNHDVMVVPKGYHPVATIAGYDNYYLNVMAGPIRKWKFTWEADHSWINTDQYPR